MANSAIQKPEQSKVRAYIIREMERILAEVNVVSWGIRSKPIFAIKWLGAMSGQPLVAEFRELSREQQVALMLWAKPGQACNIIEVPISLHLSNQAASAFSLQAGVVLRLSLTLWC
jgi:hypothetical protein